MTDESEMIDTEQTSVLAFDICSSTNIIEDLHRTENTRRWRDLLIALKNHIRQDRLRDFVRMYNFTGDGWILLLDYELDGARLLPFLKGLCAEFDQLYRQKILPVLESPPDLVGITFGMDRGRLTKIRMNQRDEYVGRALNVACRLQSAIKDRDGEPAYKMLVTKSLYAAIEVHVPAGQFGKARRKLRNIAGGQEIECMKTVLWRPQKIVKLRPPRRSIR